MSFGIVEILLIAARSPLTEQETVKALELMRTWGEVERIPVPELKTPAEAKGSRLWLRPKSLKIAASCSNVIVAVMNWILFMITISFKGFCFSRVDYFKQVYRQLEGSGWILLIVAPTYGASLFFEVYFLVCFYFSSLVWPFLLAQGLDESSGVLAKAPEDRLSPFISQWLPGWSAVWIVVLADLVYCGLGAEEGLAYDCSTTWKSGAYDLLG